MNFFRSTNKSFDLNYKIDNKVKEMYKNYFKKSKNNIDEYVCISTLNSCINEIAKWNIFRFDFSQQALNKEEIIDFTLEDQKTLLDLFNMNQLVERLKFMFDDEQTNLFEYNDKFKRDLMYCAMLKMIQLGGRNKGSEYALIFAKMFNFDYATAMQYASYDGDQRNPRFRKFLNTYLELGGTDKVYWLPKYFDKEDRFVMEELEDVISFVETFYEVQKIKRFD